MSIIHPADPPFYDDAYHEPEVPESVPYVAVIKLCMSPLYMT